MITIEIGWKLTLAICFTALMIAAALTSKK